MRNRFAGSQSLRNHFVKKRSRDGRLARHRLTRHHSCPSPPLPTQTSTRRPSQTGLRVRRLPRTKLRARPPSQTHPPSRMHPSVQEPSRARPSTRQLSWAQRHSQARPSARQPSRTQLPIPAFRSSCRTLHHGAVSRRISCNTCLTLHLDSLLLLGIVSPDASGTCQRPPMRVCLHDFFTRFIPLFRNTPFDYSCIVETIPNEKRGHVLQPLRNRKREHSEVLPPMRKRAPGKRAIK